MTHGASLALSDLAGWDGVGEAHEGGGIYAVMTDSMLY